MRLILITPEEIIPGETAPLNLLFEEGLELLQVRKPDMERIDFKKYLLDISPAYYSKVVVHDHFEVALSLGITRIHLNRRQPDIPDQKDLLVSRSCHSLEELKEVERYEYLFLSPVFDSVSKQGYRSRFPEQGLKNACNEGIITDRIIALGGVGIQNIKQVAAWGFGGIALIGNIWGDYAKTGDVSGVLARYKELSTICKEI